MSSDGRTEGRTDKPKNYSPLRLTSGDNQVLSFLNVFIEHGKIIADYIKKGIERISQLLCSNVIVERP